MKIRKSLNVTNIIIAKNSHVTKNINFFKLLIQTRIGKLFLTS